LRRRNSDALSYYHIIVKHSHYYKVDQNEIIIIYGCDGTRFLYEHRKPNILPIVFVKKNTVQSPKSYKKWEKERAVVVHDYGNNDLFNNIILQLSVYNKEKLRKKNV